MIFATTYKCISVLFKDKAGILVPRLVVPVLPVLVEVTAVQQLYLASPNSAQTQLVLKHQVGEVWGLVVSGSYRWARMQPSMFRG